MRICCFLFNFGLLILLSFFIDFAGEEKQKEVHTSPPTMLLASTWPPKSMLSYIIPVDSSKQSQNDASTDHRQQHHLQLSLIQGRFANGNAATTTTATTTPISKETSISSFASDGTTATITSSSMTNTSASDRHKTTKIIVNGKHQPLKR